MMSKPTLRLWKVKNSAARTDDQGRCWHLQPTGVWERWERALGFVDERRPDEVELMDTEGAYWE